MIKLGIIGHRNHPQRLIDLIEKNKNCKLEFIYHPEKIIENKKGTNDLSDLFKCDGVLIASPNHTHLQYIIKFLNSSKVKIFCEKPPVNNEKDLKILEGLSSEHKQRIFFNFNFRFSDFSNEVKKQKNSSELGKIIQINMVFTHGLAFKKEYENSWRSDGKNNLHSILDTLAIHYIDLMNFHFGKSKDSIYLPYLNSKMGTSFDTAQILLKYNDGMVVNILTSYAAPLVNELSILGTNGFFTIRDNIASIYSPRDNFDKNGFFISPPLKDKNKFLMKDDYNDSLKKSLSYFINIIEKKDVFDLSEFDSSILTNKIIINLHSQNK